MTLCRDVLTNFVVPLTDLNVYISSTVKVSIEPLDPNFFKKYLVMGIVLVF